MAHESHALLDPDAELKEKRFGSIVGVVRGAAGIGCLLGPVVTLLALVLCFPGTVEVIVASYAREYVGVFENGWSDATVDSLRFALATYSKYSVIRTVTVFYNSAAPALFMAGIAACAGGGIRLLVLRGRSSRGRVSVALAAFATIVAGAAFICSAPTPLYLAAVITTAFLLNFVLPGLLFDGRSADRSRALWCLAAMIWLGALVGLSHVLAPVGVLVLAAWCVRPQSSRLVRLAVHVGQTLVLVFSFPVIVLAVYAAQPTPLSPQVRPLLEYGGLYDLVIDRSAGRLLVTESGGRTAWETGKTQCAIFALKLDTLEMSDRFHIPSLEVEDIELDSERREIYHVDRATGVLFIIDADTFEVRNAVQIPTSGFSGSTKLVLDPSSDCLLISFENNNLYLFHRETLGVTALGSPGEVRFAADSANGLVYLNRVQGQEIVGFDLKAREVLSRIAGTEPWSRMALSPRRHELYVTDASAGTVRVYSTPRLQFLREIPSQFGVRATAVDDEHGLFLAASVVTGYLDVIDLERGECVARYYVGDYCRKLAVDPVRRRAFMTLTDRGLYLVDY